MASWNALNNQPGVSIDTMLLLTDGTVMCHEFQSHNWHRLTPNSSGDYSSGSWMTLASMPDNSNIPSSFGGPTYAPTFFASAVLSDGRVFVGGGEYNAASSNSNDTLAAQIYDPFSDSWTAITTPSGWTGIGDGVTCVLADGRVLLGQFNGSATALYDPVTNLWQTGGAKGDSCSEETFTLLPNGNVITVQCSNAPNAEQYIPSSNTWVTAGSTPATLPQACAGFVAEIGPAILLPDGRVFAVGATGATALYTPAANATLAGAWVSGPSLVDSSSNTSYPMDAPAVLLPSGKVLLTGSPGPPCNYPAPTTFHLYDPSTNTVAVVSGPANNSGAAFQGRLLLLPTGQVLYSNDSNYIAIYMPDGSADSSWKPVVTSCPTTLITDHTYRISGTQFNGLSQACSYGDDAQMATNYPIVRISNSSGLVKYLTTSHHSTMGVATGAAAVSTNLFVPDDTPPGSYDLFVIANGIASDPFHITVGTRDCFFILDRSTFAQGEVQALINLSGAPASFDNAVYVVVEGFSRDQIATAIPAIAPPLMGISFQSSGPAIPQDASFGPSVTQRFTFPFNALFQDTSMFTSSAQTLTVNASFAADGDTVSSAAQIELLNTPNPYILDGDVANGKPWYLSIDLRVFQLEAGQTMFGATVGSGAPQTAATGFIAHAINNLNTHAALTATFDGLPQDEQPAALTLAPANPDGTAVYNFALARIRYRDVQVAHKVRCFFRLWPAQQTNATYDTSTTYRSLPTAGGGKIPALGVNGDEIVTLPFFAAPRVSTSARLDTQTDPANVRDITPDSLGAEVAAYFGCWLDINQPSDNRFPPRLVGGNPADIPDGPFSSFNPLVSIQQLVRSAHQCLLAEISFAPDPIPPNADPSTSDKLAQRNLAFVNVPNPGVEPSRVAPQTFEIRPSPALLKADNRPDELMIKWGSTPAGSRANFYLPGTTAGRILEWADKLYTAHNITLVDSHTIQVPTGALTYIPVPQGTNANFAGLLSVELPGTVHKGEQYDIVVRQITTEEYIPIVINVRERQRSSAEDNGVILWRRSLGIFQLTIPVSTKAELRAGEERFYAILQWIQQAIPLQSRWFPVFQRYLRQVAGRVSGMGGDPQRIPPSGTGNVPHGPHDDKGEEHHESGKVAGILYDHFGDFTGFVLETARCQRRRFVSHERRVEHLIRQAWEDRSTVTVEVNRHDPDCVLEIIVGGAPLNCCE